MLDAHRLRVFRAIAREGSVSAAASSLAYSQPTVSHHLRALEDYLATPLVERGRGGAVLNDRGRLLLAHAEAILEALEIAEAAVRDRATLRSGSLRVGTFPTAGASFLPPVVSAFRERHPAVGIALFEAEPAETLASLRAGRLDLGLVFSQAGDRLERVPGVVVHHLFDDPMRVVLPASHPLSAEDRIHLSDLARDGWLTGKGNADPCTRLLARACAEAGFAPNVVLRSDDYSAIRGFVAAGLGVALIPSLALAQVHEPVAVRRLAGVPLVREIHVVVPLRGVSAAASALLGEIRAAITP